MSSVQDQSVQQLQQQGATSIIFNNLTSPTVRMGEIVDAIQSFRSDFAMGKGDVTTPVLKDLLGEAQKLAKTLKDIELNIQTEILPRSMAQVEQWIASVTHPESPTLGQDFIARVREVHCTTETDPDQDFPARYTSYSYAKRNKGFANEISFDPSKAGDPVSLCSSTIHEFPHAFQKHSAEALQLSPFNPGTQVIVHPEEWVMLEQLCEKDAYTKQALINLILSKTYPGVYQTSEFDVVTASEMQAILDRTSSLQEAVTETALQALGKFTVENEPGFTFENHYHNVALKNYSAGMNQRVQAGESGFTFLRLEAQDYHAIGNYGVGPNSLGQGQLDFRFLQRAPLLPAAQQKLETLCSRYNIPPLPECMTLREYNARQNQPQEEATVGATVASYSQFGEMVHSPV